MAQSNCQRVTGALNVPAEESAHLANVPAVNNGQALIDVIGELRAEIYQTTAQTTQRMNMLQNSITAIETSVTALQTSITTLQTDFANRMDAK